jgi:hypothetical protein
MKKLFSVVLLTFLIQAASLPAATLIANLDNTRATGLDTNFTLSLPVYQSFLVGSSNATIQNVRIALGSVASATGPEPMYVKASLFSDNAFAPDSSLGAFNYYDSPLMFSNQTPTFYGNFSVTANTRYWIQITTSGFFATENNYVRTTEDFSETGLAEWSIANSHLGNKWDTGYTTQARSIMMEINGVAVPEPSAVSLVALGIGGLATLRRVRRKAE